MIGYVVDEFGIIHFVYLCGLVSVSSLGPCFYVNSSSKNSHSSLPISLGALHIQEYFKNKRARKIRFIKILRDKASHEDQRKKMRVLV